MSSLFPPIAPVAALRRLRRATARLVPHAEMEHAAAALEGPMADLTAAWVTFTDALTDYGRLRDADAWEMLDKALTGLDEALGVFFGPSGWER